MPRTRPPKKDQMEMDADLLSKQDLLEMPAVAHALGIDPEAALWKRLCDEIEVLKLAAVETPQMLARQCDEVTDAWREAGITSGKMRVRASHRLGVMAAQAHRNAEWMLKATWPRTVVTGEKQARLAADLMEKAAEQKALAEQMEAKDPAGFYGTLRVNGSCPLCKRPISEDEAEAADGLPALPGGEIRVDRPEPAGMSDWKGG